jgi:ATPase subunit of ABC transporter with duplicated ATPase domains
MPASITLSDLAYSTADGRRLFSHLNLSFGPERTGLVGRNGTGKTTLLKLVAGHSQPQAGAVTVSGRLGFLRQSVQIEPRETVADLFGVTEQLSLLRKAESGDATVEELASADWLLEARMVAALADIGLAAEPDTLLSALSGGQRTRAALAALVFRQPDFLLLDEPTNNLDAEGRAAVAGLLSRWKAGAIVVSHDLTTIGAKRYGGNWSRFQERKALELAAAEHDLATAERRLNDVARAAQAQVERQARRDSQGRKKAARGDMPGIVAGGLKMKSEVTSGENARLAERRNRQATDAVNDARTRLEILQPFSAHLASTNLPAGKVVLRMVAVSAGYDAERPILKDVSFDIIGPERMALTGPNGSGKTTLLALITGALQPLEGTVSLRTDHALLDQTVSLLDPVLSIRDNFRRLNPQSDENACRAALARFMFRADAALQSVSSLSGGQLLRAGLACTLGGPKPPPLLILDEPTNHLDLDSIAAVERGLAAYDGALLVISHDRFFLDAIGITRRLDLPFG